MQYAVLMTVHNRREMTLASLHRLAEQTLHSSHRLTAYVVDAGSTDGTSEAIRREFPQVKIVAESSSVFWNGGMRRAFQSASESGFDGYFWLNDDTMLDVDACERLLGSVAAWEQERGPAIAAGSVLDPLTQEHAYGGFKMLRRGPKVQLRPVLPDPERSQLCDTTNGNFVYVPQKIAAALGTLEARFTHQLGDIDYGLRAGKAGFDVIVAPGYFGTCQPNSFAGTWRDRRLPFRERWQNLLSPKGAPPREWLLFVKRHYGVRWPIYAVSPYLMTLLTSVPLRRRRVRP